MTSDQFLNIHKYLHDQTIKAITCNGLKIPISQNKNGQRFVIIECIKYIQQNPTKETPYSQMAKNGHKITWGIKDGRWDLAVDETIKVFNGS